MQTLPAFPPSVPDEPDALRQYIRWRCFLYDRLHEVGAGFSARRLAPCDLADLVTKTMLRFLRAVRDGETRRYERPYGQTSHMIGSLVDAGTVTWTCRRLNHDGKIVRSYKLTDRGRSVMQHLEKAK